jgi:hypothetical protein
MQRLLLPESSGLGVVPLRAGECHYVKSMRVLDLVGDFPDVVVNVARVAVNNDDLAGGKSFVVFFCWSFFAAPLGRRIHPSGQPGWNGELSSSGGHRSLCEPLVMRC